jgi:hypothetical protein
VRISQIDGKTYEADDYRDKICSVNPSIVELFEYKEKLDDDIQVRFLRRLLSMDKSIKAKGVFEAETCYFDCVFEAEEGDINKRDLLLFIDNNIKSIMTLIDKRFTKKIKMIVFEMIVNHDNETSRFYSRVGEIAAIALFLSTNQFTILDIEKKLGNGKSADIAIQCDDEEKYIDFYSIRFDIEKIETDQGLFAFIMDKIDEKYRSKFSGLEDDVQKKCAILSILWGDVYQLSRYKKVIEQIDTEFKGPILPMFALFSLIDFDGERNYLFSTLKSVYNKFYQ